MNSWENRSLSIRILPSNRSPKRFSIDLVISHLNQSNLSNLFILDSQDRQLLHYQSTESILEQNLEELNQKLLDLHKQCEDIREHNAQLILSKQQIDEQNHQLQKINEELRLDYENLTNQLTFNAQLLEQQIQSQHPQQTDAASETIPVISQNNQTQIDPIMMIDQDNQTETFPSIVSHHSP